MKSKYFFSCTLVFFLISLSTAQAQLTDNIQFLKFLAVQVDTNYISDKSKLLTVRLLGSSKLSQYGFGDHHQRLSYKANNSYNIGVGAAYSFAGANITVKAPGFNNDNDRYGKTKKFDLQAYAFPRKFVLDLYAQYYKGFYIKEKGITQLHLSDEGYALRPDIKSYHLGIKGSYVFNSRKFSFRAAFVQNEYQKKSAGTAVLGGGIHYHQLAGDSAIIPADINYSNFMDNAGFDKIGAFSVGVHGGYAHTFVVAKHFFFTGVAVIGGGGNYAYTKEETNDIFKKRIGLQAYISYKTAIGYNSETFYAGLLYMDYLQRNTTPIPNAWQQPATGVVRLVLAKRFVVHPPWKRKKKTKATIDLQ